MSLEATLTMPFTDEHQSSNKMSEVIALITKSSKGDATPVSYNEGRKAHGEVGVGKVEGVMA
jgi:hypothetical protein